MTSVATSRTRTNRMIITGRMMDLAFIRNALNPPLLIIRGRSLLF